MHSLRGQQKAAFFLALSISACGDVESQNNGSQTEAFVFDLPVGFPEPAIPRENPMTTEKVRLGRHLFYERGLSANNTQSCADCHHQDKAFSDGKVRSVGSTGEELARNSLSLTNVAYNTTYTWANSSLLTLEQQILIPMFGEFPVELGITGNEEAVLDRLRENALYVTLFENAFPDLDEPIDFDSIVKSLAAFIRTMISGNSAYDEFVYGGDERALSPEALRGLELFLSERLECFHCHSGVNFTNSTNHESSGFLERPFHNTGLYNLDGEGSYPTIDTGLLAHTGNAADMGRFRPPTLRNIALTAPYMHDGSVATLEEVIDIYAAGGRNIESGELTGDGRQNPLKSGFVSGFVLSDDEKADLLAFLEALTDQTFLERQDLAAP